MELPFPTTPKLAWSNVRQQWESDKKTLVINTDKQKGFICSTGYYIGHVHEGKLAINTWTFGPATDGHRDIAVRVMEHFGIPVVFKMYTTDALTKELLISRHNKLLDEIRNADRRMLEQCLAQPEYQHSVMENMNRIRGLTTKRDEFVRAFNIKAGLAPITALK